MTTENEDKLEQAPSKIELTDEQYAALLERTASLEELENATRESRQKPSLDDLVHEGTQKKEEEEKQLPADLDELSNTQLVNVVLDVINSQAGEKLNKIEVAVETLRIAREIDKVEAKYNDFWMYEDAIRDISMNNESLGIEDAYQLAKLKNPQETTDGENKERKQTRTEKLLNLPPRTFGEKPSVAVASTTSLNRSETLKSAATKAWDEVVGKGKVSV